MITLSVTVPPGVQAGQNVTFDYNGQHLMVAVPAGLREGQQFDVKARTDSAPAAAESDQAEAQTWLSDK